MGFKTVSTFEISKATWVLRVFEMFFVFQDFRLWKAFWAIFA
jgi:hypothetical protein